MVYLAFDTLLDREIALKVVDEESLGDRGERLAGLFQQEARNLAGLNHPGIVQIFDYSGLYSSRLYLVMEYVPGRNLGDVLDQSGPLAPGLVAHLGLAVAGVLAYAHGHGIIHQDLKPENILVTDDGRLKLTDFGISRRIARESADDERLEVAGTPAYMAPEQALGRPVDARVDIFSLGATLYALATGATLVEGLGPTETVAAIARGDFPRLLDRAPETPEPLATAIGRALAIDPEQRYPHAAAFASALAEVIGAELPAADAIPRVPPELLPRRVAPPPTLPHPRVIPTTVAADISSPGALRPPRGSDTVLARARAAHGPGDTAIAERPAPGAAAAAPAAADAPSPAPFADAALPLLLGRFQLVRKLGSSALGEMWEASDAMAADEPVALKLFRPAPGASVDEFKAEFRDLATLRHPNLVRIRDFGLLDGDAPRGLAFYTMDLVAGPNLRRAAAGATLDEIWELLVQLSRALIFLHAKTKRPHLSLKPENILVAVDAEGRPRVVVTDPGNPTEKLRGLHRGDRAGLPYAAPECLSGLSAGPAADLYAFGVIAFELLTGRRPFVERTPETLKVAHLSKAPPDLRALRPDVPEPIAALVDALLAKEPARRPPGAEAWIRAVNQVVVPPYPLETEATRTGRFSSAPWAGRAATLEAVLAAMRAAMEPSSRSDRLVLVTGDPGVGKGRLLHELKRTAQLEGAIVLEGRPASRVGRPLGPLLPLLEARFGGRLDDPGLHLEHRRLLRRLFAGPDPVASGRPEGEGPGLDPGVVADLFLEGLTRPTVLLLRGADRMDAATLNVIARLCRALTPLHEVEDEATRPPLFMVLTASERDLEPEAAALLAALPGARRVPLGPLDVEGVADMVRGYLGEQPFTTAELVTLERVTAGVPSDVQDVLHSLIEANDLRVEGGAWRLRPGADVPLPKSVEEAMARRLAGLGRSERDVLETIAVFSTPVAANIIDSLGPEAAVALQPLLARELLVRRLIGDEACLAFAHDRGREAVLRDMAPEVRAARHRQAAQWLERTRPSEQVVEALASHWSAGGRPERALAFLLGAAERAHDAGDATRTLRWYSEALEVLPRAGMGVLKRLEAEARIRLRLGASVRAAGQLDAAEQHFLRLLEIGRDLEDPHWIATAADRLAIVMIDALRFDEAEAYAHQGYELALERGDARAQAMALRLLGSIRREQDGPGAGLESLHRALSVAGEAPELADVRARVAVALSYAYTDSGKAAKGIAWAEWGLAIARAGGLFELEVSLLINLSMAGFFGGAPETALAASREALAVADLKGLKRYSTLARGNVGDTLRVLGAFDEAEAHLRAALRETYTTGATERVVARLVELSALALDRGRPRAALPYLREAWRLVAQGRGGPRVEVALAELRLRLWSEAPELRAHAASTGELLREVTEETARGGAPSQRVRALALVAAAAWRASPEAALATAHEAVARLSELPPPGILRQTDAAVALARTLEALGDAAAAEALRREAIAAIEACAAGVTSAELRASFLAIPAHEALLAGR